MFISSIPAMGTGAKSSKNLLRVMILIYFRGMED